MPRRFLSCNGEAKSAVCARTVFPHSTDVAVFEAYRNSSGSTRWRRTIGAEECPTLNGDGRVACQTANWHENFRRTCIALWASALPHESFSYPSCRPLSGIMSAGRVLALSPGAGSRSFPSRRGRNRGEEEFSRVSFESAFRLPRAPPSLAVSPFLSAARTDAAGAGAAVRYLVARI